MTARCMDDFFEDEPGFPLDEDDPAPWGHRQQLRRMGIERHDADDLSRAYAELLIRQGGVIWEGRALDRPLRKPIAGFVGPQGHRARGANDILDDRFRRGLADGLRLALVTDDERQIEAFVDQEGHAILAVSDDPRLAPFSGRIRPCRLLKGPTLFVVAADDLRGRLNAMLAKLRELIAAAGPQLV